MIPDLYPGWWCSKNIKELQPPSQRLPQNTRSACLPCCFSSPKVKHLLFEPGRQSGIDPSIRRTKERKKLPSFFWRGFCGGICRWCLRRANGRTKVIKQIDSERQSVTSRSLVWAGSLIFGTQSKQDPDAGFTKAEEEEQQDQEQHQGYGLFTKCHQT